MKCGGDENSPDYYKVCENAFTFISRGSDGFSKVIIFNFWSFEYYNKTAKFFVLFADAIPPHHLYIHHSSCCQLGRFQFSPVLLRKQCLNTNLKIIMAEINSWTQDLSRKLNLTVIKSIQIIKYQV